jgi:hypothetical protein
MSEKTLHKAVCDYIRLQYPGVLFNSDLAGSMKLTIGQATAMKSLRSNRGFPDLVIYEPHGEWSGLFLELKTEGTKLNNKQGGWSTPHISEQAECLRILTDRGYCAFFAVGFDMAKLMIDGYLGT